MSTELKMIVKISGLSPYKLEELTEFLSELDSDIEIEMSLPKIVLSKLKATPYFKNLGIAAKTTAPQLNECCQRTLDDLLLRLEKHLESIKNIPITKPEYVKALEIVVDIVKTFIFVREGVD